MDELPIYIASIILHPAYKWRYFEINWSEPHQRAWLTTAKKNIKNLWEDKYKITYEAAQLYQPEYTSLSRIYRESNSFAEFVAPSDFYDQLEAVAARDKYKKYFKIPARSYKESLQ